VTRSRGLQILGAVLLLAILIVGVSRGLERLFAPSVAQPPGAQAATARATGIPHITATLFYATPDGQALAEVHREVPLAEGTIAQGRQILSTQMEAAPSGYLSVIPSGTSVRAFYVTAQGDAFVDLSPEVSTSHPGGSSAELLTVYAVVNAITANLPAIRRVQILIDGQEVDTLAGHVDLRRPLDRDTSLVRAVPSR
jgi:hypothetical protein